MTSLDIKNNLYVNKDKIINMQDFNSDINTQFFSS